MKVFVNSLTLAIVFTLCACADVSKKNDASVDNRNQRKTASTLGRCSGKFWDQNRCAQADCVWTGSECTDEATSQENDQFNNMQNQSGRYSSRCSGKSWDENRCAQADCRWTGSECKDP